jgi:hypothetical protein
VAKKTDLNKKVPKLTPAKKIKLRRELQSLVAETGIKKALIWSEKKWEELEGLADVDMIVQLFKTTQLLHYEPPEEKPTGKIEVYINKIIEETGLTKKEIQTMVEEKKADLEGLISEEGALFVVGRELGVGVKEKELMKSVEYLEKKKIKSNKKQTKLIEGDSMKDFWDNVEDLDDFLPFLKVKTAITYTLELIDPDADPRSSIDSFGNNQFLFDVKLLGISPKKALEDTNKDGYPLYEIGKGYAFAVKQKGRMINRFKELYENEGEIDKFKFKRTGKGFQTDFVFMAI